MSFRNYLIRNRIVPAAELAGIEEKLKVSQGDSDSVKVTLGEYLCERMLITEKDLVRIYMEISGAAFADLDRLVPDENAVKLISADLCREQGVFPAGLSGGSLCLAMKDPLDLMAIQRVREHTGRRIIARSAFPGAVNRAIINVYGTAKSHRAAAEMTEDKRFQAESEDIREKTEREDADGSATSRYVDSLISMAADRNASDIHIEAGRDETVTRIRVDGLLREIQRVPVELHSSIVARIKVMADMDIAEKRVPQDGRAMYRCGGSELDLRISSLPAVYGETVVVRILRKDSGPLDRDSIGLDESCAASYDRLIKNHSGLILISGPTGSGKSTTMFTILKILNRREVNIVTLEDPVEYDLPGANQVQINEKTGMTFVRGLKAALRQDPDIICVGEIRDRETAEIAMRAAVTGHLVISTVHTGDAVSVFERLMDMGIPGYMIASSVIGVISQRLVRRICSGCRTADTLPEEKMAEIKELFQGSGSLRISTGRGCPSCGGTGYKGRSGVFEILVMNRGLRRAVAAGDYEQIRREADASGYVTLRDACMKRIAEGTTTFDEYMRVFNTVE